ncbi:glycerol-3-phosphate dehydrogenase [Rhodoplanes serenus]|uniref:Glycerol-3-phosphate dehydrogenase n=1 Tax=Rhodoplanes serenus TaxID=200615 RepID=A0A9X4XL97_9BRAD|nr:glycerol-3-phosphate dehydrogenase [Rhodoplanes serenus]MTW17220.1 glycerol-3-phosphate dehydrogenase [Rhodoplanes serenus]
MSPRDPFDLLIIGGGINGTGLARDAAGRGASVLLVEQADLAAYTSSASTKLIHGGLRYLEYYDFRLVREALIERERLLAVAPHLVRPMRFVLPHVGGLRPAWMVRLGLFLYDHIGGRKTLPGTETVRFRTSPIGAPLQERLTKGFVYSDCWVDDARLVVLNAVDAQACGATIRTRCRFVSARRRDGLWRAVVEDRDSGRREEVTARILVNAGGPWVSRLLTEQLGIAKHANVRLVKGSHIVVPRMFEGEHAFIFQNPDRRIVFAIPYEDAFTLVGTTDVPYTAEPGPVTISAEETTYLCETMNRYFRRPIAPADVVWSYAGVRPLYDDAAADASAVTRDYVLDLDTGDGGERGAPVLSVFGGKITTYRRLAEHALEKLGPHLPGLKPAWTEHSHLPGGDLPAGDFALFVAALQKNRPFLPAPLVQRLARAYGTRVELILGEATRMTDLGCDFGAGLTEAEVRYLVSHEWARSADDILWRRTKLGLHVPDGTADALDSYLATLAPARAASHATPADGP